MGTKAVQSPLLSANQDKLAADRVRLWKEFQKRIPFLDRCMTERMHCIPGTSVKQDGIDFVHDKWVDRLLNDRQVEALLAKDDNDLGAAITTFIKQKTVEFIRWANSKTGSPSKTDGVNVCREDTGSNRGLQLHELTRDTTRRSGLNESSPREILEALLSSNSLRPGLQEKLKVILEQRPGTSDELAKLMGLKPATVRGEMALLKQEVIAFEKNYLSKETNRAAKEPSKPSKQSRRSHFLQSN
jgi:hypothetical protein